MQKYSHLFLFFLILMIMLSHSNALAYIDLNLSYTFTKRKIENSNDITSNEEAVTTTKGASANLAWYIWDYTALELNFSKSEESFIDSRKTATSDSSIIINKIDGLVSTQVQGVGLRQSFASRKARIIPSLSVGYAQLTTSGRTTYYLEDSGVEDTLTVEQDRVSTSSGYVTLQIRFRLTQLMGLTLAAKSVMPEFDTSEMENNLTYSAGFSWVF